MYTLPNNVSKEKFLEYFLNHTYEETGKKFGVDYKIINRILDVEYDGIRKRKNLSDFIISEEQNDILIGSMLGDGTLIKVSQNTNSSYHEKHTSPQKLYCEWKFDMLKPFSSSITTLKTYPRKIEDRIIYSCNDSISINTIRHEIFTKMEKEWYKRDEQGNYIFRLNGTRIKVVPRNINLTPRIIAVWFFDDGYNNQAHRLAKFSTDGFDFGEVEFLMKLLNNIGIKDTAIYMNKSRPVLHINAGSYLPFIKMVEPFVPTSDIIYKVDLSKYKTPEILSGEQLPFSKLSEEKVKYIRKNEFNETKRELSLKFNVGIQAIIDVIKRRTWKHIN